MRILQNVGSTVSNSFQNSFGDRFCLSAPLMKIFEKFIGIAERNTFFLFFTISFFHPTKTITKGLGNFFKDAQVMIPKRQLSHRARRSRQENFTAFFIVTWNYHKFGVATQFLIDPLPNVLNTIANQLDVWTLETIFIFRVWNETQIRIWITLQNVEWFLNHFFGRVKSFTMHRKLWLLEGQH